MTRLGLGLGLGLGLANPNPNPNPNQVGATSCSRGDPFVFFVRKGRTDRVILEFMGGGACWSDATCGQNAPTFSESLDRIRTLFDRTVEDRTV